MLVATAVVMIGTIAVILMVNSVGTVTYHFFGLLAHAGLGMCRTHLVKSFQLMFRFEHTLP